MLSAKTTQLLERAGFAFENGVVVGPFMKLNEPRPEYILPFSATIGKVHDGRSVELDHITDVVRNGDDGTMVIMYDDGSIPFVISPGRFSAADRVRAAENAMANTPSYRMPKTDSQLNDLFQVLYPDYKEKMYYDILRERECIDISLFDPEVEPGKFTDYTDQIEFLYYDSLERRLEQIGCKGSPPAVSVRSRVISTKFFETRRNPFKEWVQSLVWDGKPRVDTWFQRMFNASAPPLAAQRLDDLYLAKVARAWFMGAMARMDTPTIHEVVPVLIGGQGVGKSSGLRYTAGLPEWFTDTTADVSTAFGKMEFLDSARGHIIVEMSEGSQIRTRSQDKLKGFISKKEDQYRKPYQKRDDIFPRHFILAASSNLNTVFIDLTGNRRYYPIYCHEVNFSIRTQYEVEQLWAEAYNMYLQGEKSYIPSAWYPATVMQDYATADNANVLTIDNFLDNPNNEGGRYTKIGATITREEILYKIFGTTTVVSGSPADMAWKSWLKGTRCWERTDTYAPTEYSGQRPVRAYVRTRTGNTEAHLYGAYTSLTQTDRYEKCLEEAELVTPLRTGDVKTDIEERFRGKSPLNIFKMLCAEKCVRNEYDIVSTSDISQAVVDMLCNEGYIYFDRSIGEYRAVVAVAGLQNGRK